MCRPEYHALVAPIPPRPPPPPLSPPLSPQPAVGAGDCRAVRAAAAAEGGRGKGRAEPPHSPRLIRGCRASTYALVSTSSFVLFCFVLFFVLFYFFFFWSECAVLFRSEQSFPILTHSLTHSLTCHGLGNNNNNKNTTHSLTHSLTRHELGNNNNNKNITHSLTYSLATDMLFSSEIIYIVASAGTGPELETMIVVTGVLWGPGQVLG